MATTRSQSSVPIDGTPLTYYIEVDETKISNMKARNVLETYNTNTESAQTSKPKSKKKNSNNNNDEEIARPDSYRFSLNAGANDTISVKFGKPTSTTPESRLDMNPFVPKSIVVESEPASGAKVEDVYEIKTESAEVPNPNVSFVVMSDKPDEGNSAPVGGRAKRARAKTYRGKPSRRHRARKTSRKHSRK